MMATVYDDSAAKELDSLLLFRCGWFDNHQVPRAIGPRASIGSRRGRLLLVHHFNAGDRRRRQHLATLASRSI